MEEDIYRKEKKVKSTATTELCQHILKEMISKVHGKKMEDRKKSENCRNCNRIRKKSETSIKK